MNTNLDVTNDDFREKPNFMTNVVIFIMIIFTQIITSYMPEDNNSLLYINLIATTFGLANLIQPLILFVSKYYTHYYIKYMNANLIFDKYRQVSFIKKYIIDNKDKYTPEIYNLLTNLLVPLEDARLKYIMGETWGYEGHVKRYFTYFNFISIFTKEHLTKELDTSEINELIDELSKTLDIHSEHVKDTVFYNVLIPFISVLTGINKNSNGSNILYLVGEPGVGKTETVNRITKILMKYFNLSFSKVEQESDIILHEKQRFTPNSEEEFKFEMVNKITKLAFDIKKNKKNGGILFIDELDKLFTKDNWEEMNKELTVMLQDTNLHRDNFTGITIDKRNILFIIAGNKSLCNINKELVPLKSRIIELDFPNLSYDKKIHILTSKFNEIKHLYDEKDIHLIENIITILSGNEFINKNEFEKKLSNEAVKFSFNGSREIIRIMKTIASNIIVYRKLGAKYDAYKQLQNDLKLYKNETELEADNDEYII